MGGLRMKKVTGCPKVASKYSLVSNQLCLMSMVVISPDSQLGKGQEERAFVSGCNCLMSVIVQKSELAIQLAIP